MQPESNVSFLWLGSHWCFHQKNLCLWAVNSKPYLLARVGGWGFVFACAQQAITQCEVIEVEYMVSLYPGTVKVPLLFGLSVGDVPSVSCFLLSCLQQSSCGVAGGVQKLSHSRLFSWGLSNCKWIHWLGMPCYNSQDSVYKLLELEGLRNMDGSETWIFMYQFGPRDLWICTLWLHAFPGNNMSFHAKLWIPWTTFVWKDILQTMPSMSKL